MSKIDISDDQIKNIVEITEGHPFYTQHLCYVIWDLAQKEQKIDSTDIQGALEIVLKREAYTYISIWNNLTLNQHKLLKCLAMEYAQKNNYSAEYLSITGLKTVSSLQRAYEVLLKKDIIDRYANGYYIQDRFFKMWVKKLV